MNCVEAKLRLEPFANGTLEGEEKRALEEHLALCEGCRLELELRQAIQSTPSVAPQLDFGDETTGGAEAPAPAAAGPTAADTIAADELAVAPDTAITPGSAMTQDEAGEISFADLALDMPTLMTDSAQTTASSPPPAPPPPPANSVAAAKAPAPASNSWEFEPIDVPHDSAPPEGSLTFAHEALQRKRDDERKGKSAMIRIVLWGLGALAGLALLGVSIWVAMGVRQEPPDSTPAVRASAQDPALEAGSTQMDSAGTTQVGAGDDAGVAPAPDGAAGSEAGAALPSPGSQNSSDSGAPSASPTPAASGGSDAARAIQAGGLSAGSMAPLPIAPKTAAPKTPVPSAKRAATSTPSSSPRGAASTSSKTAPTGTSPHDSRAITPTGAHDAAPSDQHVSPSAKTASPPRVTSEPVWSVEEDPAEKASSPSTPAPDAARTPPGVAAPETSSTAGPSTPPASPAPQGEPAVLRPIDRLHLATQTAAVAGDLSSLRKLKTTWKNFIRSGAGQDRARAKREFADCLWAISEATTRQSDQREALAAYREYVLSAPAGGTDARTVSRMRYLEDVLSDSK